MSLYKAKKLGLADIDQFFGKAFVSYTLPKSLSKQRSIGNQGVKINRKLHPIIAERQLSSILPGTRHGIQQK